MTREEALNKAINIVAYFEAHFAKSKEAREEAANIIEALEQEPFINKPCVAHQVCHDDKIKMLDKIRAEIADIHLIGYATVDGKREIASRAVLQIIDKYKTESEETE